MKDEILEQIEKLRLMRMTETEIPYKKNDVEEFDEWVATMQRRGYLFRNCSWPFINGKWTEFNHLRNLVTDLYERKFGVEKGERKSREKIAEIVAMTMYIQELCH